MDQSAAEFLRARLTLPAYRIGEAASYAEISPSAASRWQRSRNGTEGAAGERDESVAGISYLQLIELGVVAALRKGGLSLGKIRDARRFFKATLQLEFPFAQAAFMADGAEILVDYDRVSGVVDKEKLISASHSGQIVWSDIISQRLRQFNYAEDGIVMKWNLRDESPVNIDPSIAFGAPNVHGTPTWVLRERWKSGESVADIADDFSLHEREVVAALNFEGLEVDLNRPSLWVH